MNYEMNNLRNKSGKELKKELFVKSDQLRKTRFDIAGNQIKNVKAISMLKKDIARILTSFKEREKETDGK